MSFNKPQNVAEFLRAAAEAAESEQWNVMNAYIEQANEMANKIMEEN